MYVSGRKQVRPNTTVDMMDKLSTFAGQQHQDLSPKYREKSLTWVGIEPTTSGLDHRCSTDSATRPVQSSGVKGPDAVDQRRYLTCPSYPQ